jgi:RNA 2',3'-cyclic 3'-phosphodiesterase
MDVQRLILPGTGSAVNADNLHITLVFLGSTSAERRSCIEEALAGIVLPGFSLQLDRLGYWRRPQVVWAGSGSVPAPLTTLVDLMTKAAARCGCKLDARPFQPHLTLFRKVRKPPRDLTVMTPIPWPADSFAMVESITAASGVCYKVVRTWTLTSGAAGGVSG